MGEKREKKGTCGGAFQITDFCTKYSKDPYTVFILLDDRKNRCCYVQNQWGNNIE